MIYLHKAIILVYDIKRKQKHHGPPYIHIGRLQELFQPFYDTHAALGFELGRRAQEHLIRQNISVHVNPNNSSFT